MVQVRGLRVAGFGTLSLGGRGNRIGHKGGGVRWRDDGSEENRRGEEQKSTRVVSEVRNRKS